MRKVSYIIAIVAAAMLSACSSHINKPIKCHVSGTVTGAEGRALILPFGGSSSDALARFNVNNGHFQGSFKGIENLAYELVIWDENIGQGIFTYFFPDKGGVEFTCDGESAVPISFTASSKINQAFLAERNAEDAIFSQKWADLDQRGTDMEKNQTFLSARTYEITEALKDQNLAADKRSALIEEIGKMQADSTLYSEGAVSWMKEQTALLKDQQDFRRDYITSHPDIASFFLLYSEINSQKNDGQDVSTLAETYRTVFADKFPDHLYHTTIGRLLAE